MKLIDTVFRDVQFKGCKMLGLHFFDCDNFLFSAEFENCMLNHSSFYKMNCKKMQFIDDVLHEVDFTETNLHSALFSNCDL